MQIIKKAELYASSDGGDGRKGYVLYVVKMRDGKHVVVAVAGKLDFFNPERFGDIRSPRFYFKTVTESYDDAIQKYRSFMRSKLRGGYIRTTDVAPPVIAPTGLERFINRQLRIRFPVVGVNQPNPPAPPPSAAEPPSEIRTAPAGPMVTRTAASVWATILKR